MTTNVGFVTRTAQGDPDIRATHGAGDGLGDRRLADARRSDEQQNRSLGLFIVFVARRRRGFGALPELADGQEFEHLVLHVLQAEMIFFQNRPGPLEVERFLGTLAPGQLRDGLEVGANDLRLHRIPVGAVEPRQLPLHFFARGLREIEPFEPLAQVLGLGRLVFLAELFADRFHLLAQEHLALPLAQLFLDLRLDALLRVDHADLPLHMHQHAPHPLLDGEGFEQRLAFGRLDLEIAGHQVGEPARLRHALEHLLHDVFRKSGLLPQLGGALPRLPIQGDERAIVRLQGR